MSISFASSHRSRPIVTLAALVFTISPGCASRGRSDVDLEPRSAHGFALTDGAWFDGQRFVSRTVYVIGDRLSSARPAQLDSTVHLHAGFVIPPFGDAHTHNLDGAFATPAQRDAYVREGTFYVQVLTNSRTGADEVRSRFNRPGDLDVAYANGGLTSTLGHPFMAYEPRAMRLYDPSKWTSHMADIRRSRLAEGDSYWFIDNRNDLERKWPAILAGKPDVVKIFLLDSRHYAEKFAAEVPGENGLDPRLVPEIVRRAHAAGKRVWAHIETAYDFQVAARAGVDGFAHLPGYELPIGADTALYLIAEADARIAGAHHATAMPTLAWAALVDTTPASLAIERDIQRRNMRLLASHGVRIVVGSDWYGQTATHEIDNLLAISMFSNLELLRMWAVSTPQVIFPARGLGTLADGHEASFLVLGCDPIVSFACTRDIRMRLKQGAPISAPPVAPPQ